MAERAESTTRRYQNDEIEVFFEVYRPAPRLIIVGAVHIADSLINFAKPLGFRTYLIDPRTAFATAERFPHVDEMHHQWPDEVLPEIGLNSETAVVVITHDPKLDDPALKIALPSRAFYVGALGSPKTHAKRVTRLLDEGLTQAQVDRLHAPIGLNIGGRTPAEIGLSIIAEIVATRNQVTPVGKVPEKE
jgi:xanthine dehydrogenase accessory factor